MSFAALIPAAGMSRRMGTANKLLLVLHGKPLIAHVLEAVQASGVNEICVVLGHDANAVRAVLEAHATRPVRFVTNTEYRSGLASSLACGFGALGSHDGVAVCLGDMPGVETAVIDALCAALQPDDYAAVPVWKDRWGNPALLSAAAAADAARLTGDKGARALLRRHAARVREVPVRSPAVLRDVDRREDFGLL